MESFETGLNFIFVNWLHGWIQYHLVGRRGGGVCPATYSAELCRLCVPTAHQHTVFELQLLFTVCLSSCYFQITVSHFVSIIFCFIIKIAHLCIPSGQGYEGSPPPTPPSKSIPVNKSVIELELFTITWSISAWSIMMKFSAPVHWARTLYKLIQLLNL